VTTRFAHDVVDEPTDERWAARIASAHERLSLIRHRIASTGRDDVEVVAVTKGFDATVFDVVRALGLTSVGESYAQELAPKLSALQTLECRFIGRLQTNKVRAVVPVCATIDSVDRVSLVDEIARRSPGHRVLVQVNVSDEPAKGGCEPDDTAALIEHARMAGLVVDGLMTVGRTGPAAEAAAGFRLLRQLVERHGLTECSMGMSDDLEVAVAEGATQIRIGTALVGVRPGYEQRGQ
jgi:PLP dependent protein